MLPHIKLLMCPDADIAAWLPGAKQNEAGLLVLREVGICAALVNATSQQTTGACQTPALMANSRQGDSLTGGRIPDKFVAMARNALCALGHLERNEKTIAILHAAACC